MENKKFCFKTATLGGIAGLSAPYLLMIFIVGIVMWDWNLLFSEIIIESFLARLSTIFCIAGFLIGGFIHEK